MLRFTIRLWRFMEPHSKEIKKIKEAVKKKPEIRERDMRNEAMDMGSHGAKEFFGDTTD